MADVFVTERVDGIFELRFPFNQFVIDNLKMRIPKHGRAYVPDLRAWTVFAPWIDEAIEILEEAFDSVTVKRQERQQTTRTAPPAGSDQSFAELHLRSTAPVELIHGAYRILAKLYHPDLGGDTSTMERINAAYQRIKPTANSQRGRS